MMTLRELQTQLMDDYGITAKWLESGGGQWALEIQVGDYSEFGEWLYVGAPSSFTFANELDVPVAIVDATLDDNGETDIHWEDVPIGDVARMVAREMLERTGILLP